jgi:hypothetical protein
MAGQAVLGAHGAHAVALKAAEKWPTAQLAQDDEEVAEAAVPGKQLAHTTAPAPEDVPAEQPVQTAEVTAPTAKE